MTALVLASGALGLSLAGCGTEFATCETTATCSDSSEAGAGGTGSSGKGGTSGRGGSGGSGAGTAGKAGASGNGAAGAASLAGAGGDNGEGGASGAAGQDGPSEGGAGGESGASGDDGGNGGANAGGGGGDGQDPTCDATKAPHEDTCVIHEDYGVFVSVFGDDESGDGSRENPYATLALAIEEATTSDRRVYACTPSILTSEDDVYPEAVSLAAEASGLAMFGGFSCTDWAYDVHARSVVLSPTPLALRIADTSKIRIEGFSFVAQNAVVPGDSSIGAFVADSTEIAFRYVSIQARNGARGADGTLEPFVYPAASTLNGNSEPTGAPGTGGAGKVCTCQEALVSRGGAGGIAANTGRPGANGFPNHGAGLGGTPGPCTSGGAGGTGADAVNAPFSPGATTYGVLTSAGVFPAAGTDGIVGNPGQGGGGGASRTISGHGGGGGCGGCGGNAGRGGQGGGASLALVIVDSGVEIANSSLASGAAGDGGAGHAGQIGQQAFGTGGSTVDQDNSCPGGAGGKGANGGGGGGGAGGISIGIIWKGAAEPTMSELDIATGSPGTAGIGGDPGANDGIAGGATEVIQGS